MSSSTSVRYEKDLLGGIAVPAHVFYGAQTQRAVENFPLNSQRTIGQFPAMVKALMYTKQAAAETNAQIGLLPEKIRESICVAAKAVLEEKAFGQFPVHYLHGGGGTSANMNANEVLANMAEKILGGKMGEYELVHPNDHVNLNQSTNDVYPTACHIAIILPVAKPEEFFEKNSRRP